jgi:hypothetical protein
MENVVYVVPGILAYGPKPSSKTIEVLAETFSVIVNLRQETPTSHWYAKKEDVRRVYSFSKFESATDTVKSRDMPSFRQLCHSIVRAIALEKQTVYIHDMDGRKTAPFVAAIAWYWYKCDQAFDPIAERRKEFDFRFMKNKAQCMQFNKMKTTIHSTMLWANLKKKRKKKRK